MKQLIWRNHLAANGEYPAITWHERCLSSGDVLGRADAVQERLSTLQVRAGDAVAIRMDRNGLWLPVFLGIWDVGGIAVPIPPTDPELATHVLAATRPRIVISDAGGGVDDVGDLEFSHSGLPGGAMSSDVAYVLPTSGSTGQPKMVAISHDTFTRVIENLHSILPIGRGDTYLHTAQMSFSSSMRQLFVPVAAGATSRVFRTDASLNVVAFCNEISAQNITVLDLTPSHIRRVISSTAEFSGSVALTNVRTLMIASEVMPAELLRQWRSVAGHRQRVFHLYGQTETGGAIAVRSLTTADEGEVDIPLSLPFETFGPVFEDRGDGTSELVLEGLGRCDHYLDDGRGSPLGRHRTGDRFRIVGQDKMLYVGRTDAQIKRLGRRVDVAAIERRCCEIQGVVVAVLVDIEDEQMNLLCLAYLQDGAPTGGVERHIRAVLDAERVAARVLRVDEMPVSRNGKLDRHRLAKQVARDLLSSSDKDPLRAIWSRYASDVEGDFYAAGGDSISMISLLAAVHANAGARVLPETFMRNPTLAGLRAAIVERDNLMVQESWIIEPNSNAVEWPTAFQRGLWVAEQIAGQGAPYWLELRISYDGPAHGLTELSRNYRKALGTYDILRTVFDASGEALTARVLGAEDPEFGRWIPIHERSMADGAALIALSPYDESEKSVAVRIHHAIADRTSIDVLVRVLSGEEPTGDLSFRSFNARSAPTIGEVRSARSYWEPRLVGQPHPRTRGGAPVIMRKDAEVPDWRGEPVEGVSSHARWLHAFASALATEALPLAHLIGVDVSLRDPDVDDWLIGPAMRSLPVVVPVPLTRQSVASALSSTLSHRRVDIRQLIRGNATGDKRQPLFLYKLVYQREGLPEMIVGGERRPYLSTPSGIAEHDVTLFVRESAVGVHLSIAWDAIVVNSSAVDQMLHTTVKVASE